MTIETNEKIEKFEYFFDRKKFIKNGDFDFRNYDVNCITNMVRILNNYCKLKWSEIQKNHKDFNYHKIGKNIIEAKKDCFGEFDSTLNIFIMKLTKIERFLFVKVKNFCYPIGYDKYHFLYSKKLNCQKINVNSLKHCLYNQLRVLLCNTKATKITNDLIKNQISFKDKNELENKINIVLEKYHNQFPNKYYKKKQEIKQIITNHLNFADKK
ncbi:hypothetical protein [Candidatus Phytoplasma pyri]|uniref:hypothetical protein n=1 Tax=Candidatus Phytoplasma pyri TaxID=47566 RepID=UPI0039835E8A